MSLLFGAFDSPQADQTSIRFLPEDPQGRTVREVGDASVTAAWWLRDLAGRGGSVAAVFTASFDCLAVIFGAWRAGLRLVSLPHPARGMTIDEYQRQIETMCAIAHATHLLVDPNYLPLIPQLPVSVHGFHEYERGGSHIAEPDAGSFVQFTSGSTGNPRGVLLSLQAIEANLMALLASHEPDGHEVACSWLPLSHDMGFIGMLLGSFASLNPPWSATGDLILIRPEAFLSDPGIWLRSCSEFGATFTAAPSFALRLAGRMLSASSDRLDLAPLRSLTVGSEPISAEVLRTFAAQTQEHGFSPSALTPAYGLAEATLGVTAVRPMEQWSSVSVDGDQLSSHKWQLAANAGPELVSCGRPLDGVDIRIAGDQGVGTLEIRSPALMDRYLGTDDLARAPDAWFQTADLAHIDDGELFVIGRTDDIIIIGGRNIDARVLDAIAERHATTRPGNAAAISDGTGQYVMVIEPNATDLIDLRIACREIKSDLFRQASVSPTRVLFIERGTLPKTPSGKIRRNHLRALYERRDLTMVAEG